MSFLHDWLAIAMAGIALLLVFRRDFFLRPRLTHWVREVEGYPGGSDGLGLRVHREGTSGLVSLRHGIDVGIASGSWSIGTRRPASSIQVRVRALGGSLIVQSHAEDTLLVERLPGVGPHGSSEVFVNIPLMVPGEKVTLTFWHGIPDQADANPPMPEVLVRHSEALSTLVGAPK